MDYLGARYYASLHGRFSSVDPALGSGRLEDPQTWNRYLYVRNTPTRLLDTNGEDIGDFLAGVKNGLLSSYAFNAGRIDAGTQDPDFRPGQIVGDTLAGGLGALEILVGTGGTGGGAAATATGVGAPAGVPLTVASVALTAHGATVATTGAVNAAVGLTNLVFKKGDKSAEYSDAQRKHFQRTFDKNGAPALQKARKSIEGNLKEHLERINAIKEAGGKTSSLEREVRNWERELKAIDDILREQQ